MSEPVEPDEHYREKVTVWHDSRMADLLYIRMLEQEARYVREGRFDYEGDSDIWGLFSFGNDEEDLHPIHVYNAFCKRLADREGRESGLKCGTSWPRPDTAVHDTKRTQFGYRYGWGKAGEGLTICYYPTDHLPDEGPAGPLYASPSIGDGAGVGS